MAAIFTFSKSSIKSLAKVGVHVWIKQNLKLKSFVGVSDNAVMTQIMVAMCVYLLLAYVKFSTHLSQSLQQMIRLIRVNAFIRRSMLELFRPPDYPPR